MPMGLFQEILAPLEHEDGLHTRFTLISLHPSCQPQSQISQTAVWTAKWTAARTLSEEECDTALPASRVPFYILNEFGAKCGL